MNIGKIDTDKRVFVVAEIGNNHEGKFELAVEMIKLAAESGADAVKFQTIIPEKLVAKSQTDRISQLKQFQLSYNQYFKLSEIAKGEGIIFLSTPFDLDSAKFLNKIVPAFKIASGDNNFFPLIDFIAGTGKPIIISTGFLNINEIDKLSTRIYDLWKTKNIFQKLALLHCVSLYPTPEENVNLLSINSIKTFSDTIGYSDHTLGIDSSIISVAVGARIIEKHFTIDNEYSSFHDHKISANPKNFKKMVRKIRKVEKLLGNGIKNPSQDELRNSINARRSIIAEYDLESGHKVQLKDLIWLRPGNGISVSKTKKLLGRKIKSKVKAGDFVVMDNLE